MAIRKDHRGHAHRSRLRQLPFVVIDTLQLCWIHRTRSCFGNPAASRRIPITESPAFAVSSSHVHQALCDPRAVLTPFH